MMMKNLLLLGAVLAAGAPTLASAQDGFALRLGGVFNSSTVEEQETDVRLSDAAGWNVGAELMLPMGVAVGVSGYTSGSPNEFDVSEGTLVALADLNYFFRLPVLPLTAYAGMHVGLGTYNLDDVRETVRPEVDFGDRGWQAGVRLQATSQVAVDAQYRRVSGSLSGEQNGEFESNQFVIGLALF